jgi:preprotein translocase subunit SecY
MTYQDEDRIRNPNDPRQREWGTGSMISILIAAAIMAGIIVYGATNTNTPTGPTSTASHPTTTG